MSVKADETANFKFQANLGGSLYQLSFVPRGPGFPQNEEQVEPAGKEGLYRVVISLGRPGFSAQPEGQFSFNEQNKGNSHLAIAPPALVFDDALGPIRKQIEVRRNQAEYTVDLSTNEAGFLGRLIAPSVSASNASDAISQITEAVSPFLSTLSAHFDIPLRIEQTEAIELRTQIRTLLFVAVYNYAPFNPINLSSLSNEFLLYVSYYREALGSNTAAYQFLCFYKILEALRRLRERMIRQAVALGQAVGPERPEFIPQQPQDFVPWLNALFPMRPEWDDLDLTTIFCLSRVGRNLIELLMTTSLHCEMVSRIQCWTTKN